jgi:hypothetical protein
MVKNILFMADRIQLEVYSFGIRENRSDDYRNFGGFHNEGGNVVSFLSTFMRYCDSLRTMKVDEVTKRTYELLDGSILVRGNIISGLLEYGVFGYSSKIKNTGDGEVKYNRENGDTEPRPYYFLIYAPDEHDTGIIMLQRTGRNGIKSVFEATLKKFYRDNFDQLIIEMRSAIPRQLIDRYIDEGNFGSLTLTKYGLPGDIADRILDNDRVENFNADQLKIEIKISSRIGGIPANFRVRNFINDHEALFFDIEEIRALGFDNESRFQIESTLGGKKRTIDLNDNMRFKPYYDINDDVNFDINGNPTFESINIEANALLNDLMQL